MSVHAGLDWGEAEYELLGETVRAELARAAGFEERLHPRDNAGKFARKPGGGAKTATAAPPGAAVEARQAEALAQATADAEQALSARMTAMDAEHRAEMAKITAEMRGVQQELEAAHGSAERKARIRKALHHFLMLALTGIGLLLATKYEMGPGAEIAATLGPLGLQGILDLARKAA
jgi:hypothetical protein